MGGVVVGLDFTAVMLLGAAQDADMELLSEILPAIEAVLIAAHSEQSSED